MNSRNDMSDLPTIAYKRWVGALASLISIIAGLYLLFSQSASAQTTVFDALMHGIGGYLIARGVWMIYSLIQD